VGSRPSRDVPFPISQLTLAEAAQMMRAAVKDKSYRATPVGLLVGPLSPLVPQRVGRDGDDAPRLRGGTRAHVAHTRRQGPLEVTVDDLREVIDLWADREARTRAKVTSVVRAFWSWAEGHDQVPFSPAAKLRRPRAPAPHGA
jgi:hypothetical protein